MLGWNWWSGPRGDRVDRPCIGESGVRCLVPRRRSRLLRQIAQLAFLATLATSCVSSGVRLSTTARVLRGEDPQSYVIGVRVEVDRGAGEPAVYRPQLECRTGETAKTVVDGHGSDQIEIEAFVSERSVSENARVQVSLRRGSQLISSSEVRIDLDAAPPESLRFLLEELELGTPIQTVAKLISERAARDPDDKLRVSIESDPETRVTQESDPANAARLRCRTKDGIVLLTFHDDVLTRIERELP